VLDAYGHISARSDKRPGRFIMSRSRAPALVTTADLMELDTDSEALGGDERKGFIERYIHGEIYRRRRGHGGRAQPRALVIPFGVTKTRCGRSTTWARSSGRARRCGTSARCATTTTSWCATGRSAPRSPRLSEAATAC